MTRPIDGPAGAADTSAAALVSVPTALDPDGRPTEWKLVDPNIAAQWDARRWEPFG